MTDRPTLLVGAPGSPYSRKMRAVLRYRRIPHRWIVRGSPDDRGIPEVPVALIPVLVLPDGTASVDSTFQIRALEALHPERSLTPEDPVVAFLDSLLEDFADEWLTKAMFHYRWSFEPDVRRAGAVLPLWRDTTLSPDRHAGLAKLFCERQVGRRALVGINDVTAPLIESGYQELLGLLDAHLQRHRFVLGARPGASDFGLFGQLTQLALFDPTSVSLTAERAPRVTAWVEVVEDLSGIEVDASGWLGREEAGSALRPLLELAGRSYVPFLLANAAALERGEQEVRCEIQGRPWVQPTFRYQAKCLGWLREAYAALGDADRAAADEALAGTGCEALVGG